MPASSVAIAIAPPNASTSLTKWPFPMPPIEGLHDIWPSVSMLCVSSRVLAPMRADASEASVPAWPPPTTITSKRSEYRTVKQIDQKAAIVPLDTRNARLQIRRVHGGKTVRPCREPDDVSARNLESHFGPPYVPRDRRLVAAAGGELRDTAGAVFVLA